MSRILFVPSIGGSGRGISRGAHYVRKQAHIYVLCNCLQEIKQIDI